LLGLLAVTCVFFFLYGPVEVALPIYIARDLHGSSALLGAYWTAFGVGAVVGGLSVGRLRNRRLSTVVVAIIIGWGAALLPIALTDVIWAGLIGLSIGGLIYGPFTAICVALFQRMSPPHMLSRVLASRTALTIPSTALGTLAGGPVVTVIGAQPTLLTSSLLTIALGVIIAAALWIGRRSGSDGALDRADDHAVTSGRITGPRTARRAPRCAGTPSPPRALAGRNRGPSVRRTSGRPTATAGEGP